MSGRCSLVVVLALVLGGSATAWAEDTERDEKKGQAVRLIEAGNNAFAGGDYEAALALYRAAYDAYSSPKIFFNLGRCHQRMDDRPAAAAAFERFLFEAEVDPASPLGREANARLEALFSGLGKIRVESNVKRAQVLIDGADVGRLPLPPRYLAPGRHTVEVRLPGHDTYETVIDVHPRVVTPVRAKLLRLRPQPEAKPNPKLVRLPPEQPATPEPSLLSRWWLWAAVGVAATAAVGIAVGVGAKGDHVPPEGELGSSALAEWERL